MPHVGILALLLCSAMTCSLGFTMDRSALAPPAWDTAPSLDAYRRVLDPASPTSGETRPVSAGVDKILRASANASTIDASVGRPSVNRTRDRRSTTGKNVVADTTTSVVARNDTAVSAEESTGAPTAVRNVVLLLIEGQSPEDEREDRENSWRRCKEKLPFAVDGFLQSCREKSEEAAGSGLVSENEKRDCDCERLLRSNVAELLSWARNERGMTTGVVSSSNFTIPPFLKYEGWNGVPAEFDGSNESDMKSEPSKSKRDPNDARQVIDLADRTKPVPTLFASEPKLERATGYDGAWDILDVFSKIRMAFFRSLLESLGRNDGAYEDEFLSRGMYPLKPTATDSIGGTIKELKSIPTDRGYMLIAVAPRSELANAVDLLQRETSAKNTLLVMTQICSADKKPVRFVARGPNDRVLREARAIWELPYAIRRAIANDRRGENRRRRNTPIDSPVEVRSQETPARKRVIRDEDTAEKQNTVSTVKAATAGKEKQVGISTSSEITPR